PAYAERHVDGCRVAAHREVQIRADARRLPARQHVVRPGPHPGHRRGLADHGRRAARPRPVLFPRDQPAARGPVGGGTGPRRGLPPRAEEPWSRPFTQRNLLAGLTVGDAAGAVADGAGIRLRGVDRARRRHDADHAGARRPGDPRTGQPGTGQPRSELTQSTASATVLTVVTPKGSAGRSTMITGMF